LTGFSKKPGRSFQKVKRKNEMEAFAIYLMKSAAWISGFGLIYILFLRKERFFNLKRLYLLTGIVASFVFPFINIHYNVELPSAPLIAPEPSSYFYIDAEQSVNTGLDWYLILIGIYISGLVIIFSRLLLQWWKIHKSVRRSEVRNIDNIRLVRADEYNSSFSFFNYVFVNPGVSEFEMKEIMNHELVHVNQKHWFDLLLGEIMRLIQWINPIAWIYTGLIRINHEYLADAAALQRTSDPAVYKAALLNQVFRSPIINLSNSFNYSVTKTRFDMMKNIITSPYRKLRVLLVIPVFAIIFYAFALPEYTYVPVSSGAVSEIIIDLPEPVQLIRGEVLTKDGKPLAGATITVSGTSNGAVTGTDGRFVLSNVPDNAEIIVSCKGFRTETVRAVSGEMVIHMTRQIEVVGYGSEKTTKQIEVIGYGRSKNDSEITIRSTENPDLKPVVILDGNEIDMEQLGKFSPDLISSISVLKDQSSIALYGDKGKDGVIIITSKKKQENDAGNGTEIRAVQDISSNPLIIIDDKITDRTTLNGINPNMIESISVLKNSEKYGEKGKEGVILVKLKRGVQMEKNDSTATSGKKPLSPEARNDGSPRTLQKGNFSGSSRSTLLKFIGENTRYPAGARNSRTEGKVNVIVKVAKGGIVRESKVTSAEKINVSLMPEVVIVGYPSASPDELRPNDNAPLPKTFDLLEKESLRVANLLGNADIPEWKERDMEFAITLNYILR
jgi:TonB-dependent SusC/RagA subfamily outer membrane receptor